MNICIICNDKQARKLYCKECKKQKEKQRAKIKNEKMQIILDKIKRILVSFKGGACELCKYKKCSRSLVFHHIVPEDKKFTLDTRNLNRFSINEIIDECEKCQLLCHNCHYNIHQIERDKIINKKSYNKDKYIKRKIRAINYYNNECNSCQLKFDKSNIQLACFHHLRDKLFDLNCDNFIGKSDLDLESEIKKCILVCHNCHHEIHSNIFLQSFSNKK